jgi:hypothetical protein
MNRTGSTVVTTLSVLCAVLAAPTAYAVAASPTLTPPPPAFETCKTVGSGTICQGSRTVSYGPQDSGIPCGPNFSPVDQGVERQVAIRYYDGDGNLTRREVHNNFEDAYFSNPATGKSVAYWQHSNETAVLATPGDLSTATVTETGQVHMSSGTGAPLLIATGRQVFSPDGDLLSTAGRNAFIAAFFQGDAHALDALCNALV